MILVEMKRSKSIRGKLLKLCVSLDGAIRSFKKTSAEERKVFDSKDERKDV